MSERTETNTSDKLNELSQRIGTILMDFNREATSLANDNCELIVKDFSIEEVGTLELASDGSLTTDGNLTVYEYTIDGRSIVDDSLVPRAALANLHRDLTEATDAITDVVVEIEAEERAAMDRRIRRPDTGVVEGWQPGLYDLGYAEARALRKIRLLASGPGSKVIDVGEYNRLSRAGSLMDTLREVINDTDI